MISNLKTNSHQNMSQKTNKKKTNKILLFFVVPFVLFLAWVINKDISIPSWLIITGSIISVFALIFFGLMKPEIPFYVLVAYLPFNATLTGTFGGFMTAFNLTNILILISVFCWITNRMLGRQRVWENNGLNWLVLLFCLIGIFSVVRGGFYYGSRYFMEFIFPLKRWLTPIFLYFIALNIIKDKQVLKNTIIIIMVVVSVAGLLAVKEAIDIGGGGSFDSSRVGGIAQQPNMMAAFFVCYMFLFLGFFYLNWNKIQSWALLIPFLICFRGIQVTYSRGAYLAFGFALVAITFLKNKLLFILMCIGIILAVLNPQWLSGGLQYALSRTDKGGEEVFEGASLESRVDASSATRIEIWKGAFEMIKDSPILGVGYGVFPYAIPYYVSGVGEMDAHNTYLIIAAEMGIFALLIFLLIIFVLFKNSFWLYKRTKDNFVKAVSLGMLGGLSGLIVVNMFGSRLNSEEVSSYLWILAGLIIKAVNMKKRKEIT